MNAKTDQVNLVCDGQEHSVPVVAGETLLNVLRERLGVVSVKDGCSPQGQCGCCTVLINGEPRLACVTPATRVDGRTVTTLAGLPASLRDSLAAAFVTEGASQCGFCTPGIMMRAAALFIGSGLPEQPNSEILDRATVDRALAAHLCRCTGWQSIVAALTNSSLPSGDGRDLVTASRRASLEGGVDQRVGTDIVLGEGGFADDTAPRDARVAVPLPPDSTVPSVTAAGREWVVADSVLSARANSARVPGRRTTRAAVAPLPLLDLPVGGVRLITSWVEPAYLEPDASWCNPGGEPASALAQGGAFGGKQSSPVAVAARELADHFGTPVRTLWSREDTVRLGPKRPPISATAIYSDSVIEIVGKLVSDSKPIVATSPYRLTLKESWTAVTAPGPPTATDLRAFPLAERTVLIEAALNAARIDRSKIVRDDRVAAVLLDTCAEEPTSGALAGACVVVNSSTGVIDRIEIRVAAGDPLDETVLRSYCVGAAHMALGWVRHEGLTVDPATGEVLDLTIRSFGILRASDTPVIEVVIIDDDGPGRGRASDAVFAAVASAAALAIGEATGSPVESFPCENSPAQGPCDSGPTNPSDAR